MSISSTGLYGSATIVNTDLFDDVEALKEEVTTLSTSYLLTTNEHRIDISKNRQDISSSLSKINDISNNRIVAIEQDITDISNNRIVAIEQDITSSPAQLSSSARKCVATPPCVCKSLQACIGWESS